MIEYSFREIIIFNFLVYFLSISIINVIKQKDTVLQVAPIFIFSTYFVVFFNSHDDFYGVYTSLWVTNMLLYPVSVYYTYLFACRLKNKPEN